MAAKRSLNPFTTNVLALVAKVLGRKYDVNITIGGNGTACTDGQTIHLPAVAGDYAEALARGYIDHEAAHIRLTDMRIMPTKDFKGQLLNVIEDIRIEKGIGKDYPGCLVNLKELSATLVRDHGALQPNPDNPSSTILSWICTKGRTEILNHESMRESAENVEPMVRQLFGKHFTQANKLVAKIGTLSEDKTGTAEAATLRDEFMKLLKDAKQDADTAEKKKEQEEQKQEKEKQQKENSSSKQDKKDEKDQGKPEGADGQKDKDDQGKPNQSDQPEQPESGDDGEKDDKKDDQEGKGKGEDQDQADAGGDEPGDDEAGNKDGSGAKGDGATPGTDPQDNKNEGDGEGDGAGDQAEGKGQGKGNSPSDSDSKDQGDSKGQGGKGDGGDSTDGKSSGESSVAGTGDSDGIGEAAMAALVEALGTGAVEFADIGELLEKLLGAAAQKNPVSSANIPKLLICEPRRLYNSDVDFPDLVYVKSHTAKLRAQLTGLVQASKLKRSLPAREGRRLDNRVLSRIRVGDDRLFSRRDEKKAINTAVMMVLDGSSSMDDNRPDSKMGVATRSCFVALEALYSIPGVTSAAVEFNDSGTEVYPLCGWGEKPDSRMFNHDSRGGTCLGHALWFAWSELRFRPEPRKICIIFSDGDTSDRDDTRAAIKRMQVEGMEMVGIGIKDRSLIQYLPNETRVITDLAQLTPALLELLRTKLLEKKAA